MWALEVKTSDGLMNDQPVYYWHILMPISRKM